MALQTGNIFEDIINNIDLPVLLIDKDLVIRFANVGALQFMGMDNVSSGNYNFSNFVQKGSIYAASSLCNNGFKGIRTGKVRMSFRSMQGKVKHGYVSSSPIKEEGAVKFVQLVVTDLTDIVSVDTLRRKYFSRLEKEVDSKRQHSREILRASVLAIAALAESIDKYTYSHLQRIRHYCRTITTRLKTHSVYGSLISDEYIELMYELSPLHDLGKVGIRDSVLQKKGKLSDEDRKIMQEHTTIGANALKMAGDMSNRPEAFALAEMIARFHHQKWDGTGYPEVKIDGEVRPLKGDEIPLCARIVSFADVFDALTSERPYKKPYPFDLAKKMVCDDSGRHFDPDVVGAFLDSQEEFKEIRRRFPDKEGEDLAVEMPSNEFELAERDSDYKEKLVQDGFAGVLPQNQE